MRKKWFIEYEQNKEHMILFIEIIAAWFKKEAERIIDYFVVTAGRHRMPAVIKIEKTRAGR